MSSSGLQAPGATLVAPWPWSRQKDGFYCPALVAQGFIQDRTLFTKALQLVTLWLVSVFQLMSCLIATMNYFTVLARCACIITHLQQQPIIMSCQSWNSSIEHVFATTLIAHRSKLWRLSVEKKKTCLKDGFFTSAGRLLTKNEASSGERRHMCRYDGKTCNL